MPPKYINVPYVFDTSEWALQLLRLKDDFTIAEMAQLMDVSPKCIDNWINERHHANFQHPSMSNMLKLVNLLDIHPAIFFKVSEE